MQRSIVVALVLTVAAVAIGAHAQERERRTRAHPTWDLESAPLLFSAGQTHPGGTPSWLTMQCEGDAPRYERMRCTFEHTAVFRPNEERVRERLATFDRDMAGVRMRDLTGWRNDCLDSPSADPVCACFASDDDDERAENPRDCYVRLRRAYTEARARACRLQRATFYVDMERVSRTRWAGTLRGGVCGNVTAFVLDGTESLLAWTLTQTRVAVDDASDPLCGGLQAGGVSRFETMADDYFPAECAGFAPAI